MERIPPFLNFLLENKILISLLLDITYTPARGYHVLLSSEAKSTVKSGTLLAQIPKSVLLGASSSVLSNIVPDELQCSLVGVILAYQAERELGDRSPWNAYLAMLPKREGSCLTFWSGEEKEWLNGTDAMDIVRAADADLDEMYDRAVGPFYEANRDIICEMLSMDDAVWIKYKSREAFFDAASVVAARCFEIDTFFGLALCPVADLFNHSDREDIHFESQFEVCELCGSSGACEHVVQQLIDHVDERETRAPDSEVPELEEVDTGGSDSESEDEETNDTCDIVAHRNIVISQREPRREVYNSYGQLSSARLLVKYGFAIRKNRHDFISLERELRTLYREASMRWNSGSDDGDEEMELGDENGWEDEQDGSMRPESDDTINECNDEDEGEGEDADEEKGEELKIDIYGRVNRNLWIRLLEYSRPSKTSDLDSLFTDLGILNSDPRQFRSHAMSDITANSLKILLDLIDRRWKSYKDGGITSSEYDFVNSRETDDLSLTAAESKKRNALIILANEKEMLELAKARCERALGIT
ncbi:hypothetical protein V1512DRAFT_39183 [Lipomyces arxii]|uniref:uncharacterized protein n=1 Tax=Lipomyces arxii TaxID=56418 RepID=UPI0034CD82F8